LDSAYRIEEESTILVTDTFCVLTSVIGKLRKFPKNNIIKNLPFKEMAESVLRNLIIS
jgi:hypothetical protein